jgi:hypothetical protein
VVAADAQQQRAEAAHASGAVLQALLVPHGQQQQQEQEDLRLHVAEVAAATAVQRAWRRAKATRVHALFARVERYEQQPAPAPAGGGDAEELASFVNPSRRPAGGSAPTAPAAAAAAAQPPSQQRANARVVASLSSFGSSALRRQGLLGRK